MSNKNSAQDVPHFMIIDHRETVSFEDIQNKAKTSGLNADIAFNDEGEAYVVRVELPTGPIEIGPGFSRHVSGEEKILAYPDRLHAFRTDGTAVDNSTEDVHEKSVLDFFKKSV